LTFESGEKFNKDQENTVGVEFGAKIIESKGTKIKIQIWDTAGQEAFQSITRSYYRSAAGVLLVFDLTCEESFENVERWFEETQNNGNGAMVVCLVGNKCDLEPQ
jgi:Ras-related protein Rab-2A